MDWADFYKERYDKSMEEKQDLLFQFGWVRGKLFKLQNFIDSGSLQADDSTMNLLREVANALESADIALTEHKAIKTELIASK